ncbi:hypothetical protein SAMN02799631_00205 [Methylobacterium sp. 174MFSha1.1]|nr:hypothetical protein SAMN02799631_00205 [Methylobacterium sp. 174MFSha1.1]
MTRTRTECLIGAHLMNMLSVIPGPRSGARNPDPLFLQNKAERSRFFPDNPEVLDSGLRCAAPE